MTALVMCPVCHIGYLHPKIQKGVAVINNKTVAFSCSYAQCVRCESEVMDHDDQAQNANECDIIKVFIDSEVKCNIEPQ